MTNAVVLIAGMLSAFFFGAAAVELRNWARDANGPEPYAAALLWVMLTSAIVAVVALCRAVVM